MNTLLGTCEVKIRRGEVNATVELWIEGRRMAETTMDRNVQRDDPRVVRFVNGYFNVPTEKEATA